MHQIETDRLLRFRSLNLYDQFLKNMFCDIILNIGNQQFPVHACVLAACSEKLDAILQDACARFNENEVVSPEVKLEVFTPASFTFLSSYMYKGTLSWDKLGKEDYKDVLAAAKFYGFKKVEQHLMGLIRASASPDDATINQQSQYSREENVRFLTNVAADCYEDAFLKEKEVNCMLCNERLTVKDIDHVIQHLWQHKLTANGVTEVLEDVSFEDATGEAEKVTVPPPVHFSVEIDDDCKLVNVNSDAELQLSDNDTNDELSSGENSQLTSDELLTINSDAISSQQESANESVVALRPRDGLKFPNKLMKFDLTPIGSFSSDSKRKYFHEEFQCYICSRTFKYQKAMESHVGFCKLQQAGGFHGTEGEKRSLSKKAMIDKITSGRYTLPDEETISRNEVYKILTSDQKSPKTWNCPLCPHKVFKRKSDQVTHIRSVHGKIKRFICDRCNKPFQTKTALQSHFRGHTGEKPYLCNQCGACFSEKKSMEDHVRRHTGERPFLCTLCGKDFTFRQSLYRHMKFHEGKRPYQCPSCGKCFVLKQNLKDHMVRHEKSKTMKTSAPAPVDDVIVVGEHRASHDLDNIVQRLRDDVMAGDGVEVKAEPPFDISQYDVSVQDIQVIEEF